MTATQRGRFIVKRRATWDLFPYLANDHPTGVGMGTWVASQSQAKRFATRAEARAARDAARGWGFDVFVVRLT